MPVGATIGAGVLGAGAQIFGAQSAAKSQKNAAAQAMAMQKMMLEEARGTVQPWLTTGKNALNTLEQQLPFLTSPIVMDQAALEQTPGYQFALQQAQRQIASSPAGRTGSLATASKDMARFATGLADQTYQTQFNLENINRQNAFNRLSGVAGMGQQAAGTLASALLGTGNNMAQNFIGMGNAQAGANMATGNAIAGGLQSIPNALLTQQWFQQQGNRGATNNALSGGMYTPVQSQTGWYQPSNPFGANVYSGGWPT